MKLTSKGRFAVMSLVDIAINSVENKPVSLSEISSRQTISLGNSEAIPADNNILRLEGRMNVEIDDIFIEFWEKPITAASIAQVHKARIKNNQLVAVKLLRPNIKNKMRIVAILCILVKKIII